MPLLSALSSGAKVVLTERQKLDWLRLIRSEGIGPRTFLGLVNRFGGASEALEALPDLARQRTGKSPRICSRAEAEQEWEKARKLGIVFVARGEAHYPVSLASADTAPPLIAVRGQLEALLRPMVAIVGSRNCSVLGGRMAEKLASGLAAHGYVIVSGLARGIDARAHEAVLGTGTVAVLAGGLDRIYPDEHRPLADRILEHGALVSEMPLGAEPRGRDFPRRNRIVSGLAYGTIVVEAAERSGSLITAQFALDQGREVFAVPGSPLDPRAAGPNRLIRERATLVRDAEDVVEALAPMLGGAPFRNDHMSEGQESEEASMPGRTVYWDELDLGDDMTTSPRPPFRYDHLQQLPSDEDADVEDVLPAGSQRERLLDALGVSPVDVNDVGRALGLNARDMQVILFEMVMSGDVLQHAGGRISRRP